MRMKRYVAPSIRDALARIREEQGPEAVILSNREVAAGIEVVVAVDYDESLWQLSKRSSPVGIETTDEGAVQDAVPMLSIDSVVAPEPSSTEELRAEMQSMRSLMQEQLSRLAYDDLSRRYPLRAAMVRNLLALGIEPALTESLAQELDESNDEAAAWRALIARFANRIPLAETDVCAEGGTYALVGPTGVGKTTTIAKLAARHALRHGADQVGLVTTDTFRIGAQDHLMRYGAILGTPVQVVANAYELRQTLDQLATKKLVLIDTTGFGARDMVLQEKLGELVEPCARVKLLLTLAANTDSQSQAEVVKSFSRLGLSGAVVTKLDEAANLGGVLSALIRAKLPLLYSCSGQRVPEDLRSSVNYRSALIRETIELPQKITQVDSDHETARYAELSA